MTMPTPPQPTAATPTSSWFARLVSEVTPDVRTFIAVAGSAVVVLQQYYGGDKWFSGVIAGLTVLGVHTISKSSGSS